MYCIMYILSCMTKHSHRFTLLLVGRIISEISVSLLFSASDWVTKEHFKVKVYDLVCLFYRFGANLILSAEKL